MLEHLRSPESNENERSVPLPSITDVMSYQSSSADIGQTQTTRDRPRYSTVFISYYILLYNNDGDDHIMLYLGDAGLTLGSCCSCLLLISF